MANSFTPKICGVCGKSFVPAPSSIYKRRRGGKTLHYCSYKCWTKHDPQSTNNLTRQPVAWYNEDGGDNDG